MTPEVRKQIEEGVKEIAKKSTAPDKETPDWMETDIRRGAEFGYSLASKALSDAKAEIETWKTAHKEASEHFIEMATDFKNTETKLSDANKEIERLKGLIEEVFIKKTMFELIVNGKYEVNDASIETQKELKKFKTENNL